MTKELRRPSKNKTKIVSDDLSFLFFDYRVGKTYEYVLEIADRPSRLGFPEGTLTSVCVYEQETIKLNTDHYFIEQYHRQRAPLKHLCRCVLLRPINWNLDQNLGRIRNRRRHCS